MVTKALVWAALALLASCAAGPGAAQVGPDAANPGETTDAARGLGSLLVSPDTFTFPLTDTDPDLPLRDLPRAIFVVSNAGRAAIGPLSVNVTPADEFPIPLEECRGKVLPPGGACAIGMVFRPLKVGARTGTMTVGAPGASALVRLSGVGTARITLSASAHDFGPVLVGQTSTFPLQLTFDGPGEPGRLFFTLETTRFSEVTMEVDQPCRDPVWPGFVCDFTVSLRPRREGRISGTLRVSAVPGGPLTVALAGRGIGTTTTGFLDLVQPSADPFRGIELGQSSEASFTVENNGSERSGPVMASTTGEHAGDFTVAYNDCRSGVRPADTCRVAVLFRPMVMGRRMASLEVSASPGGSASLPLSASSWVRALFSFRPDTESFGPVKVGSVTRVVRRFTITGFGSATSQGPLAVSLAGGDAPNFQLASNACQGVSLTAGASCSVEIAFAPISLGKKTASVVAMTASGASASATLFGEGLEP